MAILILRAFTIRPGLSQFRLRRNCMNLEDFEIAASLLRGRFFEKGYSVREVEGAIRQAQGRNRVVLCFRFSILNFIL